MLNEDTRHERPGHRDEFVDGPEPDPFGFVQSPRDYIAIHNRPALLSGIIARGAQSGPSKSDKCRHSRRDDRNARADADADANGERSEEQTSELQSLMRNSYAVFCLKKKKH